jgi:hypothetical protein
MRVPHDDPLLIYSSGHLVIWSSGHLVIWSSGHLVIWSFIYWAFGHLIIWSFIGSSTNDEVTKCKIIRFSDRCRGETVAVPHGSGAGGERERFESTPQPEKRANIFAVRLV